MSARRHYRLSDLRELADQRALYVDSRARRARRRRQERDDPQPEGRDGCDPAPEHQEKTNG